MAIFSATKREYGRILKVYIDQLDNSRPLNLRSEAGRLKIRWFEPQPLDGSNDFIPGGLLQTGGSMKLVQQILAGRRGGANRWPNHGTSRLR